MAEHHHEIERTTPPRGATVTMWSGLAAPPLAFLAAATIKYSLAPVACHTTWGLYAIHATAVIALAVSVSSGLLARRELRGRAERPQTPADRYVGTLALAAAAFFTFALLAQWLPSFILDPCQR